MVPKISDVKELTTIVDTFCELRWTCGKKSSRAEYGRKNDVLDNNADTVRTTHSVKPYIRLYYKQVLVSIFVRVFTIFQLEI